MCVYIREISDNMSVLCVVGRVMGVTQLHDVVFVVRQSSTIFRFNATTHQRLKGIKDKDLKHPWDIASCEQTSHVYVAEYEKCIWRGSAEGADIRQWLTQLHDDKFIPYTLSVTSTRLLVTSCATDRLMQFDADGNVLLRRLYLPGCMRPSHAVESPTGTFIVSHRNTQLDQRQVSEVNTGGEVLRQFTGSRLPSLGYIPHSLHMLGKPSHAVESPTGTFIVGHRNTQLKQGVSHAVSYAVSEVNTGGEVLRQFTGSRLSSLGYTPHVAVDSHGNIFVADHDNGRILLLDAHLTLRRVIIDKHQLNYKRPYRLCYREQSGQLLVGFKEGGVSVFDVVH